MTRIPHLRLGMACVFAAVLLISISGCGGSEPKPAPAPSQVKAALEEATGVGWELLPISDESSRSLTVDPQIPVFQPSDPNNDADGTWFVALGASNEDVQAIAVTKSSMSDQSNDSSSGIVKKGETYFISPDSAGAGAYEVFNCVTDKVCVTWLPPESNELQKTGPLWNKIVSAMKVVTDSPKTPVSVEPLSKAAEVQSNLKEIEATIECPDKVDSTLSFKCEVSLANGTKQTLKFRINNNEMVPDNDAAYTGLISVPLFTRGFNETDPGFTLDIICPQAKSFDERLTCDVYTSITSGSATVQMEFQEEAASGERFLGPVNVDGLIMTLKSLIATEAQS